MQHFEAVQHDHWEDNFNQLPGNCFHCKTRIWEQQHSVLNSIAHNLFTSKERNERLVMQTKRWHPKENWKSPNPSLSDWVACVLQECNWDLSSLEKQWYTQWRCTAPTVTTASDHSQVAAGLSLGGCYDNNAQRQGNLCLRTIYLSLPASTGKAERKSWHGWDLAQSSASAKSQPALCCFGRTSSCSGSLCWQVLCSFSI